MKYLVTAWMLTLLFACDGNDDKELVWSDEFEADGAPDPLKWNFELGNGCPQNCGWGNHELQYYTQDPANVRVTGGKLVIEARKDSTAGSGFTSAKIVSKGKGDWRYGRFEIKAKLPRGRGTWPAIWMLPTDWKYGGWPSSGEIDIMEHVGFDPGVIHGTIHTESYNHIKGTQKGEKIDIRDAQDTFHVYAIDWTADRIDFFVDDKLYYTVTRDPKEDYKGWPFDQRFYLIMNIAVGGDWGGTQGVDTGIWPQRMEIDFVRVYKWK